MTLATVAAAPGCLHTRAGSIATIADVVLGAGIAGAVLLSHPFMGIMGDGKIYVGRALADLDPGHVGQDVMFRYDGQSGFTIFRPLARWCIAHLGIDSAVWLLSVGGLVAYSLAIVVCVRSLRPGQAIAVVLAAALLLPRAYAPFEIIAAGEAFAIPRPWAEALVLLALACLAEKRIAAAVSLVALAAAFHPIMALPGLVLLVAVLGARHSMKLVAAGLGLLLVLAAAGWAGLPLASRAVEQIDPTWLAILRARNSYLFVSLWSLDAWCRTLVLLATLLVGAAHAPPVWARLMRGTVVVAVLGCLASFVGADLLHSLLVTQVQLWRSMWLAAALAPVAAGICLPALVLGGWKERAVLSALVAAWASTFIAPANAMLALLALGLALSARSDVPARAYKGVCLVALLVAGWAFALGVQMIWAYLAVVPADARVETSTLWRFSFAAFFVIALVAWCASPDRRPLARLVAAAWLVAVSGALVATRYDERTVLKKDIDSALVKPDLVAALARRPGEVLWLDDETSWYWTRRPSWNERLQGAGIVFSRDLAMLWHDRAQALVDLGLTGDELLDPLKADVLHHRRAFNAAAIARLCTRSDAPAWIVMPLDDGRSPPADTTIKVWTLPFPQNEIVPEGAGFALHSSSRRLLIPCRS